MGHELLDLAQPCQDDEGGLPGPCSCGPERDLQSKCGPNCAAESAGESLTHLLSLHPGHLDCLMMAAHHVHTAVIPATLL